MAMSDKNRTGSIFYWKARQCWCADVYVQDGNGSSSKRKRLYGKTQNDVLRKMLALDNILVNTMPVATYKSDITVTQLLHQWLTIRSVKLRPKSVYNYQHVINTFLVTHIGNLSVSSLNADILCQLYLELLNTISRCTVDYTFVILKSALDFAVKRKYIDENPVINIGISFSNNFTTPNIIHALSLEQVNVLLQYAKDEREYPLYVTAVLTGMRQGELFALNWDDVNLESGVIYVRNSLCNFNGNLSIGPVKTKSSRRNISLPQLVIDALLNIERSASNIVFTDTKGGYMRKSNFHRKFIKLLEKAELPAIRFHDLRHTHATLLLQQGVHPKIVQERLGHSTIKVTMDTYSHVLPSMQMLAVNELNKLF